MGAFKGLDLMLQSNDLLTVYNAKTIMDQYIQKQKIDLCKIKYVWLSPQLGYVSYAFPKNSQFLPFFNHLYHKLREKGHMDHLLHKWVVSYQTSKCTNTATDGIPIEKIVLLLLILLVGVVISVLISLLENLVRFLSANLNKY